jgi:hypothetical protein
MAHDQDIVLKKKQYGTPKLQVGAREIISSDQSLDQYIVIESRWKACIK